MTIPAWKKWLSYLKEIHLESAPSDLNPHLYVSLIKGRIQLSTANAIYSYEDLYDNFGTAFKFIDWVTLDPNRILVLGGGLLSVPYLLEKYLSDSIETTVVEYDEEVIYLATKYMVDKLTAPLQMIHADASVYVNQCEKKFDLIVVDVFDDDVVPDDVASAHFLERLKALSESKTLVLINRLSRTLKDLKETKKYYSSTFQSIYPQATYLDVNGNWILVNTPEHILKP